MGNSKSHSWVLLLLVLLFGQAWAMETDPLTAVRQTADITIEQLRLHRAELNRDPSGIYPLVERYVLPRFDFETISRFVLGKYWREATPTEQKEFIAQFRNLMVRTYAHALLTYSDQQIRYLPLRADDDPRKATVSTSVGKSGAPDIPIDYKVFKEDSGDWKVYDVVIDGVSLVANYRTSFSGEIKRLGIGGLIKWMEQHNQEKVPDKVK